MVRCTQFHGHFIWPNLSARHYRCTGASTLCDTVAENEYYSANWQRARGKLTATPGQAGSDRRKINSEWDKLKPHLLLTPGTVIFWGLLPSVDLFVLLAQTEKYLQLDVLYNIHIPHFQNVICPCVCKMKQNIIYVIPYLRMWPLRLVRYQLSHFIHMTYYNRVSAYYMYRTRDLFFRI